MTNNDANLESLPQGLWFEDFEPGRRIATPGRTVTDGDIATFNEDLEPWVRTADERPSLLDFAIEQLGLILDPFPRKDGAEVSDTLLIDPMDRPEKMSPFAALAALKKD